MSGPARIPRGSLLRGLALYGALLVLDVLAVIYIVGAGVSGFGFATLTIIVIVGGLLAYQVWTHLLDLRAPLVETTGAIERKWRRADLLIAWHSYYLTVGGRVFKVAAEEYVLFDDGMPVTVEHFPHTLNVVAVRDARPPKPLPGR